MGGILTNEILNCTKELVWLINVSLYKGMTYFDDVPDSLLKPFKFK